MKLLTYAATALAALAAVATAASFYAAVWVSDPVLKDRLGVTGLITMVLLIPMGAGAALLLSELDDDNS